MPHEPPAVLGVLSTPFLLQEGFHLCDNPPFHSFVTNFTAKGQSVLLRSKALLPVPQAGGQTPPSLAVPAATLLAFINPVQPRPGGGRTHIQMLVHSVQSAPSCCQQTPVCPLASSKCKALPGKGTSSSAPQQLSFYILKQSYQSLKMPVPPGRCHKSDQRHLPQPMAGDSSECWGQKDALLVSTAPPSCL